MPRVVTTATPPVADQLTAVLTARGHLPPGVSITDVESRPLGRHALRLRVRTSDPSHAVGSLVAKPLATERELRFYRSLGSAGPVAAPPCLHADAESPGLLLLGAVGGPAGDVSAGLAVADARSALTALAALHALGWGRLHAGGGWLARPNSVAVARAEQRRLAQRVPVALNRYRHRLGRRWVGLLERYVIAFPALHATLGRAPLTLCHGACTPDHVIVGATTTFVSWHAAAADLALTDVASLLVTGLTPQARADVEEDLLRSYHTELAAAGVAADGWEALRFAYRGGVARTLGSLILLAAAPERDDELDESVAVLIERVLAAAEEHRVWELLRD